MYHVSRFYGFPCVFSIQNTGPMEHRCRQRSLSTEQSLAYVMAGIIHIFIVLCACQIILLMDMLHRVLFLIHAREHLISYDHNYI